MSSSEERLVAQADSDLTYVRIAEVWSGILGHHINPSEVTLMLAGAELVRAQRKPEEPKYMAEAQRFMRTGARILDHEKVAKA